MVARINFDMIYRYSHNPSFNYFDIRFRDKAVYGISLNNKTSSHEKLSILVDMIVQLFAKTFTKSQMHQGK